MRTTATLAIVSLALMSCEVEPIAPPPNFVSIFSDPEPAPAPPWDIRNDPASTLFVWPLAPAQAAKVLKRSKIFADTAIGITGMPPPQMAAFNVLLDQPNAIGWFDDIRRTGGGAGQLYALCAFQVLDSARAANLADELRARQDKIYALFGCSVAHQRIGDIVDALEKDACGKQFREARDHTYKYFSGSG
ncbi:MAG TPA: hypothetical protein VNJ70_03715 [Thermoanaerobaculia bacterium]|nr:hypothetical protein [Thermoanaerobaculia bacterium]